MISFLKDKRYDLLLLVVIAFFPLFKMAMISISIILFITISFYLFFNNKITITNFKLNRKWVFITSGFYLWMIVAILYSSNIYEGFESLQSSVAILIFPIVIFLFIDRIPNRVFLIINFCFVIANIFLSLYIHYYLFSKGIYSDFKSVTFWDSPVRDSLAEISFKELHPTYISLWFLYSVLYMLDFLVGKFRELNKQIIFLVIIGQIILLFTTILLSTRMTLIAFIVAIIVYSFYKIKNKLTKFLIILVILITTIISVFNVSYLRARLIDEFKVTKLEPPVDQTHNSINIRVGIYHCSFKVLKPNWLIGVGAGNVQKELNICYNKFNTDVYQKTNYNTHNQYLHIFIASGIIGLVLFLFLFYYQIKLALLNKDYLYLAFTILLFISFLSENILVRINGVIFFALFNTLFIKKWIQNKNS